MEQFGNLFKIVFRLWFRVQLVGSYEVRYRTVLLANKTSHIDALILALFLPDTLTIAVPASQSTHFKTKILRLFATVILVDLENSATLEPLIAAVNDGKTCLIFPEGSLETNEEQLKSYRNCATILNKSNADIIPLYIQGLNESIFSTLKRKNIIRLFPKVIIHVEQKQPQWAEHHADMSQQELAIELFKLITGLDFANNDHSQALFPALIKGVALGKKNKTKIEDVNRTPLTYAQFLARCFILGRQIKTQTEIGEHVGVMLPTTIAGMVTFFALHAYRRIPAMLNFSSGLYNIISACKTASVQTIYTSSKFVETAKLESLIDELKHAGLTVYFLEDFKSTIGLGNKLAGLVKGLMPAFAYKHLGPEIDAQQVGVILFTSGSEGLPKAVALSHANIAENCHQMKARVDFSHRDQFFNSLPIFHCFGLTAGSILPIFNGLNSFLYPSPLHYKIIPNLVSKIKATIMFGTDTFLNGYARASEGSEFSSIRYIYAGAEKVKPETSQYWAKVLGATIYEGYGVTETAPVVALNCYFASIPGSVGMALPQIEYRIEKVEGISEGGRLFLRGPNVMLGYIDSNKPGEIIAPKDGWHDTGDIVSLNANGFITIKGRAKRFAKIGGEMVSLTAVEGIAGSIWPELLHAAIIEKTPNKGERIILYTESEQAEMKSYINKVKELGQSELYIPFVIHPGFKIPILPSGKIDYFSLERTNT